MTCPRSLRWNQNFKPGALYKKVLCWLLSEMILIKDGGNRQCCETPIIGIHILIQDLRPDTPVEKVEVQRKLFFFPLKPCWKRHPHLKPSLTSKSYPLAELMTSSSLCLPETCGFWDQGHAAMWSLRLILLYCSIVDVTVSTCDLFRGAVCAVS